MKQLKYVCNDIVDVHPNKVHIALSSIIEILMISVCSIWPSIQFICLDETQYHLVHSLPKYMLLFAFWTKKIE